MKERKNSRKEEKKKSPYDKLTESLMKKGGLVTTMISLQPSAEELKIERIEESKNERLQESIGVHTEDKKKVERVKKNYYVSKDSVILLEVMTNVEKKTQGQLIEQMILERFKKVYPTYDELDKEVFKRRYLPQLSKRIQEELKDILD